MATSGNRGQAGIKAGSAVPQLHLLRVHPTKGTKHAGAEYLSQKVGPRGGGGGTWRQAIALHLAKTIRYNV